MSLGIEKGILVLDVPTSSLAKRAGFRGKNIIWLVLCKTIFLKYFIRKLHLMHYL